MEDSDDEWLASNKEGEDLDQSVVALDTNGQKDTAGHREARKEPPSKEGDNQGSANMDLVNIVKEAMTEAVKMGIAVAQGQSKESEIGECVKRLTTIVETSEKAKKSEESRKRKIDDELVITEDEVVVVEKEIKIRDDSNAVIDIQARSLLGRNPNAPPSEWWGGERRWPRVARPAVGTALDIRHLCPSYVAREAVLAFHDSQKYLTINHFTYKNSGMQSKVKRQWELTRSTEDGVMAATHERKWEDIASVFEAVDAIMNIVVLEHQLRNYSYAALVILRVCHQCRWFAGNKTGE